LADKLLNTYKNRLGEVALVPSDGGAFEISVDDSSVHSKLQTGKFPDERALIQEIGTKL